MSPLNSINYYEAVTSAVGADNVKDFMRLYMVPGMNHCGNGVGTISFGAGLTAPLDP